MGFNPEMVRRCCDFFGKSKETVCFLRGERDGSVRHKVEKWDVELLVNLTGCVAVIKLKESSHPSDSTKTPGLAGCLFVLVL